VCIESRRNVASACFAKWMLASRVSGQSWQASNGDETMSQDGGAMRTKELLLIGEA
jgi:hypothetical protein